MATNVGAVGAVQIDEPSAVKPAPTIARQGLSEVGDGRLQCRKDGMEFSVNGVSVARPVLRHWVETNKDVEHSGAECTGCILERDVTLNLKSSENANKSGNQDDSGSGWDYLQAALLGLILAGIPLSGTFMQKPNVK